MTGRTKAALTMTARATLACVAITSALAACGVGPAGVDRGPGLSRAALAARADAICSRARAQTGVLAAPADGYVDAATSAAYFDKIDPITALETRDIQALTASAAAAHDWRAFVSAQVAAAQLIHTLKVNADAKNPAGLAYLSQIQPSGKIVAAAAARIGAKICAGG